MSNFIMNLALRGAGLRPSAGLRPPSPPAFPPSFDGVPEVPGQMAIQEGEIISDSAPAWIPADIGRGTIQPSLREKVSEQMTNQGNEIMSDSAPAYTPADIGRGTIQPSLREEVSEQMTNQGNEIISDSAPAWIPADIGRGTIQPSLREEAAEDHPGQRLTHKLAGDLHIQEERGQERDTKPERDTGFGSLSPMPDSPTSLRPSGVSKPGPGLFMEKPAPAAFVSSEGHEYLDEHPSEPQKGPQGLKFRETIETSPREAPVTANYQVSVPFIPAVPGFPGQGIELRHEAAPGSLIDKNKNKNRPEGTKKAGSPDPGKQDQNNLRPRPKEIHQTIPASQEKITGQVKPRIPPAPDKGLQVLASAGLSPGGGRHRQVKVHIGSIEVQVAREQPSTRQPSPVVQQVPVNQGFSEYNAIRNYRLWRDD